jgi:hypothetical protein
VIFRVLVLDRSIWTNRIQVHLSALTYAMFKGILPSKRVSSSDFTMVTPLLDINGKENLPGVSAPFSAAQKSTKSVLVANKTQIQIPEKKKRGEVKKGTDFKHQDVEGSGMNQAFDRLLVCKPISDTI